MPLTETGKPQYRLDELMGPIPFPQVHITTPSIGAATGLCKPWCGEHCKMQWLSQPLTAKLMSMIGTSCDALNLVTYSMHGISNSRRLF